MTITATSKTGTMTDDERAETFLENTLAEKAVYEALGYDLINLLGLTKKRSTGRYNTAWGNKSPEGLGRTVARIVHEHISTIS